MLMVLFMIWSSALCIAAPATNPAWEAYKTKFGKTYAGDEDDVRYGIWKKNVFEIEQFNAQHADSYGYTQAINQFSDVSLEELKETMVSSKFDSSIRKKKCKPLVTTGKTIPSSIDWRKKGAVTIVKNQCKTSGRTNVKSYCPCGSSYAFSATGALEAQVFKKTGKLTSLSEQQIVDCSYKEDLNDGCDGGGHSASFYYIKELDHGIESEEDYPYKARFRRCSFEKSKAVATVEDYCEFNFDSANEEALRIAVAEIGPVSVGIHVTESFMSYHKGIYYDANCSGEKQYLDNHVLVVGYGTDSSGKEDVDYWLVKNSRGTDWGEDGYIRMRRNANNTCGIATMPSYPIVSIISPTK